MISSISALATLLNRRPEKIRTKQRAFRLTEILYKNWIKPFWHVDRWWHRMSNASWWGQPHVLQFAVHTLIELLNEYGHLVVNVVVLLHNTSTLLSATMHVHLRHTQNRIRSKQIHKLPVFTNRCSSLPSVPGTIWPCEHCEIQLRSRRSQELRLCLHVLLRPPEHLLKLCTPKLPEGSVSLTCSSAAPSPLAPSPSLVLQEIGRTKRKAAKRKQKLKLFL